MCLFESWLQDNRHERTSIRHEPSDVYRAYSEEIWACLRLAAIVWGLLVHRPANVVEFETMLFWMATKKLKKDIYCGKKIKRNSP